jgi:hypothetical protein
LLYYYNVCICLMPTWNWQVVMRVWSRQAEKFIEHDLEKGFDKMTALGGMWRLSSPIAVDRDPRIQKLDRYYIFLVNLEGKSSEFKTNWLSTNAWADRAFIHWVCISIQLVRKFHIWAGLVHFLQV